MKNKKNIFLIIVSLMNAPYLISNEEKMDYALVIKPIIDVAGEPLPDTSFYVNIPFSPINKKDQLSCPRLHQLLFNEVVRVIDKQGEELIIELPSMFFQQAGSAIRKNKFRALKKNFMLFSYLKKFNIDLDKIPKTINYNQAKDKKFEKTVTLKGPFADPRTEKVYSAGTRFVYAHEDEQNYHIYIFNPTTHHFVLSEVPKKLCLNNEFDSTNEKKISNFVKLVKRWANLKAGFIPYVWGGCSFCNSHEEENFVDIKKKIGKKQIHFYNYAQYEFNPKNGFDCTGMILRAAQICGLPYYFKNSTTAAQNIETINEIDDIQNGDIIWIPGHLIVVSDVINNLMTEATDYSSGYGKVHEINISKAFKNINNYDDLKKAFLQKKALKRLNKKGNIFQDISNFKILKISSIWK